MTRYLLQVVVTTAETAPAMVRKVVGGSVGPLVQVRSLTLA